MILRKFGKRWDLDEFEDWLDKTTRDHCLECRYAHMSLSWQTHVCVHMYLEVWTSLKKVLENQTFHRSYAEVGKGGGMMGALH